jgi:hypothetical protein
LFWSYKQLAQASGSDLPQLVRRAKVVASKLSVQEPLAWISHELDGYPKDVALPSYRKVPSELKAQNPFHGLIPVEFQKADWVWEHFSITEVRQPIAEIVSLVAGNGTVLHGGLNPPEMDLLRKLGADVRLPMVRVMSKSAVERIIDGVRTPVLNWSVEVE